LVACLEAIEEKYLTHPALGDLLYMQHLADRFNARNRPIPHEELLFSLEHKRLIEAIVESLV
jgi:hypothetical protein